MFYQVDDALAQFSCEDINSEVVNVTKLIKLAAQFGEDDFPKTRAISRVLVDMGYTLIGRYKDDDRKNQTIYAKDQDAKPADFKANGVGFDEL